MFNSAMNVKNLDEIQLWWRDLTYSTNQNEQLRIFNGQLGELATALGAVALVLNYPRIDL